MKKLINLKIIYLLLFLFSTNKVFSSVCRIYNKTGLKLSYSFKASNYIKKFSACSENMRNLYCRSSYSGYIPPFSFSSFGMSVCYILPASNIVDLELILKDEMDNEIERRTFSKIEVKSSLMEIFAIYTKEIGFRVQILGNHKIIERACVDYADSDTKRICKDNLANQLNLPELKTDKNHAYILTINNTQDPIKVVVKRGFLKKDTYVIEPGNYSTSKHRKGISKIKSINKIIVTEIRSKNPIKAKWEVNIKVPTKKIIKIIISKEGNDFVKTIEKIDAIKKMTPFESFTQKYKSIINH